MKTTFEVVELFPGPKTAWEMLEWHQAKDPKGTYWVRQVEGHIGFDWAVVKEVQEPWEPVDYRPQVRA
jgi:hypothetical protein